MNRREFFPTLRVPDRDWDQVFPVSRPSIAVAMAASQR